MARTAKAAPPSNKTIEKLLKELMEKNPDVVKEAARDRYLSPEAQHVKALISNMGTKTCPHCKRTMPIKQKFGIRKTGKYGVLRPHSWCYECRGSKESHPTRWRL